MCRQVPQENRRPRSGSLAITLTAIAVMWGTQTASGQDQSSTTSPQQAQRQVLPPQRQPAAPAVPVRPQPAVPNGANTATNAGAANANAARNLFNKLFPGTTGGAAPPAQPGAAAPAPANTATGTNPAMQALQGLTKGATPPVNPRNVTTPPINTRNATTPPINTRNVATPPGSAHNAAAMPGNTRNAAAPLQMASLTNSQANARAVQSRNFLGHPGPAGSTETQTRTGNVVRTAADGSVMDVHSPRNGMYIHHGLDGNRHIVVSHPDGSRIYASSRGTQYVQHPYVFRGQTFAHRTYYAQGQLTHQFYRPFPYGRTVLDVYATPRYYDANFYQWATSRFNAPQPFKWDYVSSSPPWFGYYKSYFTPDSSYSSPSSWLADYVLAASLAASYKTEPRTSPPPSAGGGAGVTPEVKQMIADEVDRQVRQESVEAQQNAQNRDPPPGAGSVVQALGDRQPHVFVVASDLDLVDASGRRCMISEGDVVQVVSAPQPASGSADAVVLASKGGGECERAARVEVALNDLQEMQNHMRETIDQGMATTNAAKKSTSVTPAFVASAPPPDSNAAHELDQQQQIAAAVEG
jgi:hypothetical protein